MNKTGRRTNVVLSQMHVLYVLVRTLQCISTSNVLKAIYHLYSRWDYYLYSWTSISLSGFIPHWDSLSHQSFQELCKQSLQHSHTHQTNTIASTNEAAGLYRSREGVIDIGEWIRDQVVLRSFVWTGSLCRLLHAGRIGIDITFCQIWGSIKLS